MNNISLSRLTDWTKAILAVGMVTLLSATIIGLFNFQIPVPNKEAVLLMLGVLSGSMNQVYGYFFGTSQQQTKAQDIIKTQTDVIADAQGKLAPVPGAAGDGTVKLEPGDKIEVKGVEPLTDKENSNEK